ARRCHRRDQPSAGAQRDRRPCHPFADQCIQDAGPRWRNADCRSHGPRRSVFRRRRSRLDATHGGGQRSGNFASAKTISAMMRALNELPKPTIARINGAAYAAGVGLIAACDIAVAVEAAVFSISEVRIGLVPSTMSPYVLAAIGARAARRYFLTGEPFS